MSGLFWSKQLIAKVIRYRRKHRSFVLAGIKVKQLRLSAFALTGVGAVAGLMYSSRVASSNPTQGSGLMLEAIATVLGMTMSEEGELGYYTL